MRIITGYQLSLAKRGEPIHVALPEGAEILSVKAFAGVPTLYVVFEKEAKATKDHVFHIVETSREPVPDGNLEFVGTVIISSIYEYQVFEEHPIHVPQKEVVEDLPTEKEPTPEQNGPETPPSPPRRPRTAKAKEES